MSRQEYAPIRVQKKNRLRKILLLVLLGILVFLLILLIAFFVMKAMGANRLHQSVVEMGSMHFDDGESGIHKVEDQQEKPLGENQVLYKGQVYEYNTDIINILFMGVDKSGKTLDAQGNVITESNQRKGGQADALFLGIIDQRAETIRILAINRNTMTYVDVFDEDGYYEGQEILQITLQHGYGDGGESSCVRQVKTVSRLLHNLPIHSYAAINMNGISILNDLVGGVTLEVIEDITSTDVSLKKGEIVTLNGAAAEEYVRSRGTELGAADARLARQKQYLLTYLKTLQTKALSDLSVISGLYNAVREYMVTDVDLTSCTYLASECVGYRFETEQIYSLPGETMMGERFEEYYVDEEALQDLLIELFYNPVEE